MPYLIDTDILSYAIHGIAAADELIDELAADGVSISIITYMEASQSVARSPIPKTAQVRFEALLEEMPVISFGIGEAERTAELFERLRQSGLRIRSRALDLLIAGTALSHGLTLVSNNADDYQDIPDLDFRRAQITP
jgi:predicted nucleic acid-binding protein